MPTFKQVLEGLMKRNNLKQTDLARELNISRQAVNKWFTKGYKPEIEHLPRLAQLFNVTTDELLNAINDEFVNQTDTDKPNETGHISVEDALKMQKQIAELQQQVIQFQAKELERKSQQLEEKEVEIARQRNLDSAKDTTPANTL